MMVPMVPGMVLALSPIQSQSWMYAVPVLGQELLVSELMRGEPLGVLPFVLGTVSCVALTAALLAVTARMLGDERIVFGRS
jgi:sodium transport system permease protein